MTTFYSPLMLHKLWTQTHTHSDSECTLLPLVCWWKARWECGAAPGAIWQSHRHLHNVIFYLISHSKCNQKLMRALSCLADWQHDIALTPNTGALHPNDAILKPSLCSYTNTIHNAQRVCVCVSVCVERARVPQRKSGCVCVHRFHIVSPREREVISSFRN